jgi:hypothetical protein
MFLISEVPLQTLVMERLRWTGLAPWEFEFPGSLTSTFLAQVKFEVICNARNTSLTRNSALPQDHPRALGTFLL